MIKRIWKIKFHNFLKMLNLDVARVGKLEPFVKFVKEQNKENMNGVEIGVYLGHYSEHILKNLSINKLYVVDPYENYDEYTEGWLESKEHKMPMKEVKKYMLNLLNKWKDKIVFIEKYSGDAVEDIPNELDFVYIDGNHAYKYVKEDIEKYYPKIKEGGVLGGHDFSSPDFPGLTNAVIEFTEKNNLQLYFRHPDWWIVKGEKKKNEK